MVAAFDLHVDVLHPELPHLRNRLPRPGRDDRRVSIALKDKNRDMPEALEPVERRRRSQVVREQTLGPARGLPLSCGSLDDRRAAFFGRDARYGHRIYGGVIINAVN